MPWVRQFGLLLCGILCTATDAACSTPRRSGAGAGRPRSAAGGSAPSEGSAPSNERKAPGSERAEVGVGAGPGPGAAGPGRRFPVVAEDHPLFARFEHGRNDPCEDDGDCTPGGCSGEVCAAGPVLSACDVLPVTLPPDAACGCVEGTCRWYSPSGATLALPAAPPSAHPGVDPDPGRRRRAGEPCGDRICRPPYRCVRYVGFAGPSGPPLMDCEIPCGPGDPPCPADTVCVTMDDGPGPVCRPAPEAGVHDRAPRPPGR